MRGYIFRALMGFAAERFGSLTLESMLDRAALDRHGAYTAVGKYPIEELEVLVDALCDLTGTPRKLVLTECGRRAIAYVLDTQAANEEGSWTLESLLGSLEDLIHVHNMKLYPGAIVPSLTLDKSESGWAELNYRSQRPLADLAEGLILGSLDYMKISTEVLREDLPPHDGHAARFKVKLSKPEIQCE